MASFTQPSAEAAPSQLETVFAQMAGDPKTSLMGLALLGGYGADRQMASGRQSAYSQAITQMQQRQAQAENANAAGKTSVDALKLITDNPGMATAVNSSPYLQHLMAGTNVTEAVDESRRSSASKRLMEAGRGAGAMSMGGQYLDPAYLGDLLGAKVTTGPSPYVQAAGMRGNRDDEPTIEMSGQGEDPGTTVKVRGKDASKVTGIFNSQPKLGDSIKQNKTGANPPTGNTNLTAIVARMSPAARADIAAAGGGKLVVIDGKRYVQGTGQNGWPVK